MVCVGCVRCVRCVCVRNCATESVDFFVQVSKMYTRAAGILNPDLSLFIF